MKVLLAAIAVIMIAGAMAYSEEETQNLFVNFVKKFDRQYETEEMFQRYAVFKTNLAFIQKHNQKYARGEVSYSMALNQFADMTNSEYKVRLGYKKKIPIDPRNT